MTYRRKYSDHHVPLCPDGQRRQPKRPERDQTRSWRQTSRAPNLRTRPRCRRRWPARPGLRCSWRTSGSGTWPTLQMVSGKKKKRIRYLKKHFLPTTWCLKQLIRSHWRQIFNSPKLFKISSHALKYHDVKLSRPHQGLGSSVMTKDTANLLKVLVSNNSTWVMVHNSNQSRGLRALLSFHQGLVNWNT